MKMDDRPYADERISERNQKREAGESISDFAGAISGEPATFNRVVWKNTYYNVDGLFRKNARLTNRDNQIQRYLLSMTTE